MNNRFASLMTELFALAGADEAECFDEDVALLSINGFDISLTLLEEVNKILISTVVAELPEENLPALQEKLLEGNLFFSRTRGFTLAARRDTGVVLQAVVPCAILEKSSLTIVVANLVAVAEYWKRVCEGSADDKSEDLPSYEEDLSMIRV